MIYYLLLILLFVCMMWIYSKSHSFIHPGFVTSLVWFCILLAYKIFNHSLYDLSDNFYFALSLYIFPFIIFSILGERFSSCKRNTVFNNIPESYVNTITYVVIISLIITILAYFQEYKPSLSSLLYDVRSNYINKETEGIMMLPTQYYLFEKISSLSTCFFLFLYMYKGKMMKISYILLVLLVLYFIIRGDKTSFISFGIGMVAIMLLKKVSLKKISLISLLLLFLVTFVQLSREDKEMDYISDFYAIYFLSPLTAFDYVLNLSSKWFLYFRGENTFKYIFKSWIPILPDNFESVPVNGVDNWVYVPLPTNVFTILFNPYKDAGYVGLIVFGVIYGFVWGKIYSYSKRNDKYLMFYISCFWMLVMQFFADWLNWSYLVGVAVFYYIIFNVPSLLIKHK